MIEPERVLAPLDEVGPALGRLQSYTSPAELAEALTETQRAVDRALRLLLRADADAPDELRLNALAPDTPLEQVVSALRQRDLISIELAGRIHALAQAAQRAAEGEVHARDGDVAAGAVEQLRFEVREAADSPVRAVAHQAASDPLEATSHDVPAPDSEPRRRLALFGALVVALLAIVAALVLTREDPMQEGVAAFRAGRLGIAERQLREAMGSDSSNVTALLYLARIQRVEGRHAEAAAVLATAARRDPQDADVRRELGYLFLDLDRPSAAVQQFQRAQELEPDAVASWVGLIRALRAAGDPAAEEWLARAPAEARALLTRP